MTVAASTSPYIGAIAAFGTTSPIVPIVIVGFSTLLFMEFIYFTAIKYIPILWIAIFVVTIVVLGVGLFNKQTTGA